MKNYSEFSDFEINKLVAISLGKELTPDTCQDWGNSGFSEVNLICGSCKDYCNNPSDAWPIIMRSGINVFTDMIPHGLLGQARASTTSADEVSDCIIVSDHNPLRAAMIVFLMMKDGENA